MTVAAPGLKICPACSAPLVAGKGQCISCGMERAKMADFLLAKKNAEARRQKSANIGGFIKLGVAVVVVMGLVGLIYHFTIGSRVEPWKAYPTDRTKLVVDFFSLIATDDPKEHDKAYALISLQAHDPDASDEKGMYRQVFHDMVKYFNGEFGPGWINTLKVDLNGDPGGPMEAVATIGTDQLHLPIDLELPPGKTDAAAATMAPEDLHFGIHGINEFSIDDAGKSEQMAVITGVLGGVYGDTKGVSQLSGIVGTNSGRAHETPFETKRRLLPIVRDPKATAVNYALYQLWPVRKDPTVQRRLGIILDDDDYPMDLKKIAKEVKDGTVSEEELIAAHVPGSD